MSNFFGSGNQLQKIGLLLSALNPQSLNATMGLMGANEELEKQRRSQDSDAAAAELWRARLGGIPGQNTPLETEVFQGGGFNADGLDKRYADDLLTRAMGGAAARMRSEMAAAAANAKPMVLNKDAIAVDQTGNEIASNIQPEDPAQPSAMMRDALMLSGGDQTKALEFVNKWRLPAQTNITMSGDRAITGVDSGRYKATAGQLDKLDAMAPGLERMMGALYEGAQTGFGQEWTLKAKQAYQEFTGQELKGTSAQEVFKSIQNYMGPQMRTPGAGASSDTDVKMFVDSIPTLSKTEEGNRALATYYGKLRERTAQILQIQQDLLRKHEYIPVAEERKAIQALGPLFSDEDKIILKGKTSSAPTKNYVGFTPDGKRVYEEGGKRYVDE